MERHPDMEMTVMQEEFYHTNSSLEKEACHAMQGLHGEAPGLVRKQGRKGKPWARTTILVSLGRNGQGRVSRPRIG